MQTHADLIVIGGGPAGLAASINAASEGLRTVVLEANHTLGGQARESMAIENYPGFPAGVTGDKLMSSFIYQAEKFGVECHLPVRVAEVRQEDGFPNLSVYTEEGIYYQAPCVILANGVSYRRHEAEGLARLAGKGVYYGLPASRPSNGTVVVVGGANSAGQAACYLAARGLDVKVVSRSPLSKGMSSYLCDRIDHMGEISVLEGWKVAEAVGTGRLRDVLLLGPDGEEELHRCVALYIFIGAVPRTFWLRNSITLDRRGFVETWKAAGSDLPFMTSLPGLFAIGDVRAGSAKRVANAVGEASAAVQMIHTYREGLEL